MASQKAQYDKCHQPKTFQVGDQVILNAKNIRRLRPSKKIDDRYLGPFTIIDAWGKQAYKLDLPEQYGEIHPVFHVNLLEPYHEREGYFSRPGPEIIDNQQEWEVEDILAQRGQGCKTQYLVKWVGYPPSENQWLSAADLQGTPEKLREFRHRQHGKLPTKRTRR